MGDLTELAFSWKKCPLSPAARGTPAGMETVTMSYEELDRVRVIERVIEKRLRQAKLRGSWA